MAILKCKMCGGDLEIEAGVVVADCEYCGTKQTIPNVDNEKKMNLFNRANRLRFNNDFDKAMGVYESIVAEFPEEAESYWGLCLCKYGIEYVDDPATARKIPTCHRTSYDSIFDDQNFEMALEYADAVASKIYREEAREIERLQKAILDVVKKEEPFDIFICYKETDENGDRTMDSVLAQDVYDALTQKGYKVFFSRITLEDKLGQEYEPYIFAALTSAKVMLAFGTCYEYYNAVWVKNEWSRFLDMMKNDKEKYLIPCYRNIDAYDMPREFGKFQAQDLGKVGAVQDLVRGIEKLIGVKKSSENAQAQQVVVQQAGPDCESLLKRAFMFLEDGEWKSADEYCEKVLDIDPENAQAYLGKLLAELKVKNKDALKEQEIFFENLNNYKKMLAFAEDTLKQEMVDCISIIKKRKSDLEEQKYREMILAEEEKYRKRVVGNIGSIEKNIRKIQEEINDLLQEETQFCAELKSEQGKLEKREQSFESDRALEEDQVREQVEKQKEVIFSKREKIKEKENEINGINSQIEKLSILKISLKKELKQKVEILQKQILEMKADLSKEEKKLPEIEHLKKTKIQALETALQKQKEKVKVLEKRASEIVAEKSWKEQELKQTNEKLLKLKTDLENVTEISKKNIECKEKNYMENMKKIKIAKVGESIFFGVYNQKADLFSEEEAIEWLVLDKKDDKILVISKYALDCQPYHTTQEKIILWENCFLRSWLNGEFLNTAFSEEEKTLLPMTRVLTEDYGVRIKNETQDQVFLLSVNDIYKYFVGKGALECKPTDYAVAKGVPANEDLWWWNRSIVSYTGCADAVCIGADGKIYKKGFDADFGLVAVRPVMWISLNFGNF